MSIAESLPDRGARSLTPFQSAEDAWFWTVGAMRARREGGGNRNRNRSVARPCDPDDILRCLDRLYRNRRIDLSHARVLRVWGEQRVVPESPRTCGSDAVLWREAMAGLDPMLRRKGIVA